MEDLAGVGKLIDSKTTRRVYADTMQPAAREAGSLAEDIVKALRLFTAPIQLAATYQDRLAHYLDDVRGRVPPDRQVEAPANVAGPVLLNMRFVEEGSIQKELYLNLLTRAIDRTRQAEAHPGFVHIIEQLSPDEALILYELDKKKRARVETVQIMADGDVKYEMLYGKSPVASKDIKPFLVEAYFTHLEALNLTRRAILSERQLSENEPPSPGTPAQYRKHITYSVTLTLFGHMFARTCLPSQWNIPTKR